MTLCRARTHDPWVERQTPQPLGNRSPEQLSAHTESFIQTECSFNTLLVKTSSVKNKYISVKKKNNFLA